MSDLISRNELFKKLFTTNNGRICPDTNIDNFPLTLNVKDVKNAIRKAPTAFDLESITEKLKSAVYRIDDSATLCSRDVINEEDVFEILKSAANATNGKNGG